MNKETDGSDEPTPASGYPLVTGRNPRRNRAGLSSAVERPAPPPPVSRPPGSGRELRGAHHEPPCAGATAPSPEAIYT